MPTKRGLGVAASVAASATDAGSIASSSGSPSVQPALLRNVRRGTWRLVMNIALLCSLGSFPIGAVDGVARHRVGHFHIHLKRFAVDDAKDERGEAVLIADRIAGDRTHHRHVLVLHAAPQ